MPAQLGLFATRGAESKVSARAEARARTNVSQSVGPLLRVGSASVIREASVVGLLSSGCEPSVPPIHPCSGLQREGQVGRALAKRYSASMPAKNRASHETPNPSVERTRTGRPLQALISFWALCVLPVRAAHLKR